MRPKKWERGVTVVEVVVVVFLAIAVGAILIGCWQPVVKISMLNEVIKKTRQFVIFCLSTDNYIIF